MPATLRFTRIKRLPHHPSPLMIVPVTLVNDSIKQKTLKRPREEPGNNDIYISQKHKQTKAFNPLPRSGRKYLSTTLGLMFGEVVYYVCTRDLGQPQCTFKTKGDENCYFWGISYILT